MMGWQWHLLDHMQIICTSFQTDNHASTSSLNFLQAGCPSFRPTNSVKALTAEETPKDVWIQDNGQKAGTTLKHSQSYDRSVKVCTEQ